MSHALSRAEQRTADAVGDLMELWGFKRQLGRIWAVLFLSPVPLTAPELSARLQVSSGLLSMGLQELRHWGVVRGVYLPGQRKKHFEAETDIWRMVRRVFEERERKAIESAVESLLDALANVKAAALDTDPAVRSVAHFQRKRIEQLVDLSRMGLGLLRALLDTAKVNLAPLKAISALLGRVRWSPVNRLP